MNDCEKIPTGFFIVLVINSAILSGRNGPPRYIMFMATVKATRGNSGHFTIPLLGDQPAATNRLQMPHSVVVVNTICPFGVCIP